MKRIRTTEPPKRRPATTPLVHLLCAALVALGIGLRVAHFPVEVHTPDEDTYLNFYAVPLYEHGPFHVPELVREYNARREMHDFPPPIRVAHLWLLDATMMFTGDTGVEMASRSSLVVSVALLFTLWAFGAAVLGPWGAAIALAFTATSPLDIAMSRRAWGDELLALVTLMALLALARHLASPTRARWGVAALALGALAILVKESGAIVLGVIALALAASGFSTGGARRAARWLGAGMAALAVAGGIIVALSGGIGPLRLALANAESTRHTNAYMIEYLNGGPMLYVRGLGILQPVSIALGLIGALALPFLAGAGGRPGRRAAILATVGLVAAVLLPALVYPTKNMRFLSPIYAPLAVLAAGIVVRALEAVRARVPGAFRVALVVVVAALVLSGIADQRRFVKYFEVRAVPDLATPWLTK